MTKQTYHRPTGTDATAVGERQRTRWSRTLRKQTVALIPVIEITRHEEALSRVILGRKGQDRNAWASIRARVDQVALLDLLRQRHLVNTGKELSRAEALAALMAAGLRTILEQPEFHIIKGTNT